MILPDTTTAEHWLFWHTDELLARLEAVMERTDRMVEE